MNKLTIKSLARTKRGFSLMELLVVIAIVAIVAGVSYPLFKGYKVGLATSNWVRGVEALAQKARRLATNQRKPYRLIINCANPIDNLGCYLDLQEAIYQDTEVIGWQRSPVDRLSFEKSLKFVKVPTDNVFDGSVSLPNIYWAIFMPASQVFSDPNPFEFFLYNESDPAKNAWKLSVNKVTGRIFLNRAEYSPNS
jgi:prepilin-type N-terminal cleavage/methylation domain-containing protein